MLPPRHPGSGARWAIVVVVVALLAASSGLTSPTRARAGAIASAKAQAAAIERQIGQLYIREDAAGEAYDKALSQLAGVRRSIRANTVQLGIDRANLRRSRTQLARVLVSAYKNGNGGNSTAFLLGAQSLNDLATRAGELSQIAASQQNAVSQVRSAERQVRQRQMQLRAEAARSRRLVAAARRHRAAISTLIGRQQELLASAKARVRQLIQARQRRLAAAAAARAAAARAAARRRAQQTAPTTPAPTPTPTPPPVVGGGSPGGSGGGSGSLPPPNALGVRAVQIAETQLGVRYTWGGASPQTGFDCSGLVMWTYAQLGISLPHYTGAQWVAGPHVPYDQLAPGDLVFFEPDIGHVGIYIGGGLYINAPHTGSVVMINSLSDPWAQAEYQGAVRVTG